MGYVIDILLGAAGSLVAAELWSQAEPVARWLIQKAVKCMPAEQQERCAVEWLSDLHEMPGALLKLLWALGCHRAAMLSILRARRAKRVRTAPPKTQMPSGILFDLLVPPEISEDALYHFLGRYEHWVDRHGRRKALAIYFAQSTAFVIGFWLGRLRRW
jgi:hypothetical protein